MPVLRKNIKNRYTVIDNNIFLNRELSLKAKGLLCQMLSLPDNWDYSLEGLVTLSIDGISSVRSALKELENQMYFKRHRLYENGKLAGVEYIVSETPMCENLILENLKEENLKLENHPQLNTKESNTKKSNTKDILNNYTDDEDLMDALRGFADMRKSIKKPLTERAWKIIFSKLDDITDDTSIKIAVLNQSIEHSWQSVYPLKKDGLKPQNKAQERLGWIDDI